MHRELAHISFHQVMAHLDSLPFSKKLTAILLTTISYAALTNYDRLSLKYIKRPINTWKMCTTSFTAFAVGHNVGMAAISAGSIRLRSYTAQGLSALETGKIVAFCGLTFFMGGATLLGVALALEPASELTLLEIPGWVLRWSAVLLISVPLAYVVGTLIFKQPFSIGGRKFELPNFSTAVQQILFASTDLIAAGATLYVLLPADVNISYPALLGAYLIAMFLGVVSSVPGGIGVFEGLILLLLPTIPKAELLSAIVAYRVSYYLIPLSLAVLILAVQEFSAYRQKASDALARSRGWVIRVRGRLPL